MLISKLKRDIELLEKQLAEVDINILDSIERIEQKKQLERKIRKLKQSKNKTEQLEKEQQELESLKSDFSLNNNELIDERESKQDKQVEHTISIIDTSIIDKSEINLSKQIEASRNIPVNNTNSQKENSDTIISTLIASPSNNSKESGKAWIIGSTIGFFIFLGLVINGYQVNQTASNIEQPISEPVKVKPSASLPSTETDRQRNLTQVETNDNSQLISSFTQQEAVSLLEKWQSVKSQIFAPPFDKELGSELLTGKAYYDNIGNPEGSVSWLQDNASYYTYGMQSIDSVENFNATENYANIEVVVTEQRTLYNQYGNIDRNASGFDTRLVRYNLESENGQWKIADYQTIKKIK